MLEPVAAEPVADVPVAAAEADCVARAQVGAE